MSEKLDQYKSAYTQAFPYTDENVWMLRAYVDFIRQGLRAKPARHMLGLGIGHTVTVRGLIELVGTIIDKLDIVEGSPQIIEDFLAQGGLPANVRVFNGLFETFQTDVSYDAVEMGFILEHVDDPSVVLKHVRDVVSADATIFAAVPNALALHRRIGVAAGLMKDPYALSPHDLELGHQRYFDLDTFSALVTSCGYSIEDSCGLLLKPLATGQLRQLDLPENVHAALVAVGRTYPELCNGFAVRARK